MRKNSSRTRLKPCSPWVIISIGCCVITRLPKPRSGSSANCCQVAARCQMPSAQLPDARDWDESVAYWEQALALDPRNVDLLVTQDGPTRCFDNSRRR